MDDDEELCERCDRVMNEGDMVNLEPDDPTVDGIYMRVCEDCKNEMLEAYEKKQKE